MLFANLAFLAWAEWIDAPQPVPPNDVYAKLPRLKLVGEESRSESRRSPESARKTALESAVQTSRCISIGPFENDPSNAHGSSVLREKGFNPRQRSEQGEVSKGFWVYIGDLKTDRDVTQVLRTLEQRHVDDARLMPDTGDIHRVSVGIFSERERAERRAQALQKLGLEPQIAERKVSRTVFWMDVDVPPGDAAPTLNDVAGADASAGLNTTPCPAGSPTERVAPLPAVAPATTPFRTKVAGASKVP
jgi:hypothetical protein